MSSAIDFSLNGVKEPRKAAFHTAQRERLLKEIVPASGDYRQARAHAAFEADKPYPELYQYGCCGHPGPRVLEVFNMSVSALCLLVSFVFCMIGVGNKVDDKMLPSMPRLAEIRLSREVLLFSNKPNLTVAMRHLQSEYATYCKSKSYEIDLQVPTYEDANVERFKALSSSTAYAMTINISAGSVSLFAIIMPVFAIAFCFQALRYFTYCTPNNPVGLYKPWRGPDLSRWLEYLFTTPFQIFLVSTAFGFGSIETVLAHCVMQAALVMLGYDVEQYIKKKYKERVDGEAAEDEENRVYQPQMARRIHNILWRIGVEDIRGGLYLILAWVMHLTIWGSIIGRFHLQESHMQDCERTGGSAPKIPDTVTNIMWSQFLLFTSFGFLNTAQWVFASPRSVEHQKIAWYWYSIAYQVLSLLAKTALMIGFIVYVFSYRTWPLAPTSNIVNSVGPGGLQCLSVVNKPR